MVGNNQGQYYSSLEQEQTEQRDQPGSLSAVISRTRTRSKSRDRARAGEGGRGDSSDSIPTLGSTRGRNSFLSRMTGTNNDGSTVTSTVSAGHTNNGSGHQGPFDKLKGVFHNRPSSRDRHGHAGVEDGMDRDSIHTTTTTDGERGRHSHKNGEQMISTGRGGAGNARAASKTRSPVAPEGREVDAQERSRERSRDRGLVGGRGGAGNFRSASKNPADRLRASVEEQEAERDERAAQEKRFAEEAGHVKSHGRGGAGNIGV